MDCDRWGPQKTRQGTKRKNSILFVSLCAFRGDLLAAFQRLATALCERHGCQTDDLSILSIVTTKPPDFRAMLPGLREWHEEASASTARVVPTTELASLVAARGAGGVLVMNIARRGQARSWRTCRRAKTAERRDVRTGSDRRRDRACASHQHRDSPTATKTNRSPLTVACPMGRGGHE